MEIFDKEKVRVFPLNSRLSKTSIDKIINPETKVEFIEDKIEEIGMKILDARKNNKPVIMAFGAHLIKNGLSSIVRKMIETGFITHLATNGAAPIHDWEISFQGKTEEDVRTNVKEGKFGTWDETGKYINTAIITGAKNNKGYGESIGEMINKDKVDEFEVKHPFKKYSIFESAYSNNIPITVHPGFGYDIIYTHPLCDGASIGKTSHVDFLSFVNSVSNLEGGVYISIGSAIMSPMIFEKALSMARNVAIQGGEKIDDFMIVVNDIQEGNWDWNSDKDPPKDDPSYYLRFCKTFHRMGAREMHYIKMDNKEFILQLYNYLNSFDECKNES